MNPETEIYKEKCGCELSVLERIGEERLIKRVYRANMEGKRGDGGMK